MQEKILVVGASGQIGTELVLELRNRLGNDTIVASDIKTPNYDVMEGGPFEFLDILDKNALLKIVQKHNIKQVYQLAALLSATAEQNPMFAWKLNMEGLFNILDLAKENVVDKIFWPSSIAVFGPTTPRNNTPQITITEPSSVYGVSKLAGERWCEYYFNKFNVDVRSIRYPGLISHKSQPGGGTTDHAIHIFYEAKRHRKYECFLKANCTLPMMYMDDAINATISIMESDAEKIKIRSSYNISGVSFNPEDLANEIKKHLPEFTISYAPDYRQQLAESWPASIDDSTANQDWGWKNQYGIDVIVKEMLKNL
ncbi:MAG: NAD-dependent epimerase/dehydratase family protein [Flavobacteriales bacterium]|nr:NAD-dependent epimerase/dehydratase family protein [Flavobacteriales bacterium]